MVSVWLLLLVWWFTLPVTTLVWYWALMHVDKLDHMGIARPLAVRVARVLLPVALIHNFTLANTWGVLFFLALPGYPGLTKMINAMVARGGWRARRGLWFRETFLNSYDRRGVHT
jgi:hypothetical protein